MNEKIYYSAEDIAKMLGVSIGKSYTFFPSWLSRIAGSEKEVKRG